MLFSRLLDTASSLRIPTLCAVCHGWGRQRVCAACLHRFMQFGPRCATCAIPVPEGVERCGACLTHPNGLDSALAAVDYAYPWDGLVAAFKFNAALDLAPSFADCVASACRARQQPAPQLLVPVPLGPLRMRERGFNPSWEIARRLASRLGCEADAGLLLRISEGPHQLSLPVDRRAANVRGAFAVEPARRQALRGQHVTVFDDVMTTGATGSEMASVLRQAGAASVSLWVLARTPMPGE
jgi:ComF family protein